MSDRDLIRHALHDAIDWQTSLGIAKTPGTRERAECFQRVARYRAVLKRRYDNKRTRQEIAFDECRIITRDDLKERETKDV